LLNQYIIEHLLLKRGQINDVSLSQTQIEQAYARLAFACAGLLYLYLHAENFAHYQHVFIWVTVAYFLITLLSIPAIQRTPLSAYRMLLFPLLDTFVVTFGMLIDGGISSGLFFIFVVIIFGNSFRFGNAMLCYSQACSLSGLLLMTIYANFYTVLNIDYTLLGWQVGTLLVVPLYIYLIEKKAEDALIRQSEAEETSFHLMDKGPLPVFTFESNNKPRNTSQKPHITYINTAMRELFQHQHDHLIKADVDILALPDDRQELLNFCQAVFKHRGDARHTTENIYIRGQDNAGNILKLMCTAICMRWHGHWVGVCFVHDITQRETMQEEFESVHRHTYMSTLVAGIVHDFRNVLTNMIGYAEVMQMNSSNDSEKQQLETIIAAGDRGSELITHLLNIGKTPDAKTASSHTEGQALVMPLQHIIGLARLQLPRQIQLVCCIDEPLHDVIISTTELEQILLNLINNSTQAIAGEGYINIQIRNEPNHPLAKSGHPCLHIQISDTGSGIAENDFDTIFKPFWTSRSSQGGTGLGLTMVQRIVKRNHGCIDVTSIPDQKTTFSIHLSPYIPTPESPNKPKGNTPQPLQLELPSQASGYHALVVDDVPDILKIHQAMLSHMGISSDLAGNGSIALELFQQQGNHFDLIITDYKMPKMDGLKLVEHIRKLDAKVPILMVSAFGEDDQLQQVIDYHVTLLNKPINMNKLKHAIATSIAN